uniref:Matrin 3-like 1.1 n=1 Tax=Scleropages formosus TaxID=113540 RepID=A0A8C9TVR2_SCLFO
MSQKIPSDGAQKGFAVGRGLLAAAETLNFSMSEHRSDGLYGSSSRSSYGMAPTLGGGDSKERDSQLPRHSASHLSNTMKLFNSLGLSPTDLDALAQVPEENISVETLPHLIMQLKSRKAEASRRSGGNSRDLPSLSPERSYRGPRGDWEDVRGGRVGGSGGQALGRGQQDDYDYTCAQDGPSRGYDRLEYGESSGGSGSRDRPYSELSRTRDRYGGFGMGASSASDSVFMTRRTGCPSQGKVQDFLGVMPQIFPHVCSLCDFDVHSTMEWTQHTNGLRHLENRRLLLQVSGSILLETTNRSAGLLGPAPGMQGLPTRGMASNWDVPHCPFSVMHGKKITFYLSQELVVIEKGHRTEMDTREVKGRDSQVVFFSNLPREQEKKMELLTLARHFGTVEKHLFLNEEAFIQLGTPKDARMMVKYYTLHPLTIDGRSIRLNICTKYKTLISSRCQGFPIPHQEAPMDQDFPENMDDFVTLDEVAEEEDTDRLDTQSKSGDQTGGGFRVVNVVGFKRGYNFLDEILTLAKPFGKVVRHLVLDVRPEAFLELSSEEEARAMVDFYSANVTPMVCGKAVKIYHSQTYATIQVSCQSYGRVIYVGQLPSFKTSDASLLKIAEPFGKVRRYFLNRNRYECFIEMERGEDAERMANAYKENPPKFQGKRLTVYVSRKYKQLKHGYRPPPEEPEEQRSIKREHTDGEEATHHEPSHKAKVKKEEEPLAKRLCVREESATAQEPGSSGEQQPQEEGGTEISCSQEVKVNTEELEEKMEQPSDAPGAQKDREAVSRKLSESTPCVMGCLGFSCVTFLNESVEYMKMGYYCRVCFLFYSNEETAKKVHCSSLSHYEKLKVCISCTFDTVLSTVQSREKVLLTYTLLALVRFQLYVGSGGIFGFISLELVCLLETPGEGEGDQRPVNE